MAINKIITTTEEQDINIIDVTLLTVEEAKALDNDIREIGKFWWLRSSGYFVNYAACVDDYGCVYYYGDYVSDTEGVRPALKISNLSSSNLSINDTFEMTGHTWTVISEDTALCNDIVGKTCFRSDWRSEDANNYEKSDIKKWLANWVNKNGIEVKADKAVEE